MIYFITALLLLSHHIFQCIVYSQQTAGPRTHFRRYAISSTAAPPTSKAAQVQSYPYLSGYRTDGPNTTITSAPVQYPQSCPGCCLVGNPIPCTGSKTWDGPSLSLSAQCVLWDQSCSGDISVAAQNFFDNVEMMDEKPCWRHSNNVSLHCAAYEPAQTLSAMSKIKDWMRGAECMSRSLIYQGPVTSTVVSAATTEVFTTLMTADKGETCCGEAIIEAQNVDIYYWPEPDANTACLGIIGNSVNPLYYGATTTAGPAYWGCTAKTPNTISSTSYLEATGSEVNWTIITNVESIITTARITNVNSLTFKYPLVNPWSPPACVGQTSGLRNSTFSAQAGTASKSIHARGHSLVIPSSMTQTDGLPISTIVSDGYTL